jgi:endonuclease/exonuclease/phosphatase (EEP) superfamily protein YafD
MRFGKISSGVWLCLAVLIFGGGVMFAFYRAAHDLTHPSNSASELGIPARPLRLASFNAKRQSHLLDEVIAEILRRNPDYLFLQETRGKTLPDLQHRLGEKYVATAYYPLQNLPDADNDVGIAILSKYPLEEGRPIPNHMNGACGVWASSLVDGKRFEVACLRPSETGGAGAEMENFRKAWESLSKPPILAAVESGGEWQTPPGFLSADSDRIWLFSKEWRTTEPATVNGVHFVVIDSSESTSR